MQLSLRRKVALAFSVVTVLLLLAQALGVRVLAEAQEERLIGSVIADDMREMMASYRASPANLPPLAPGLKVRVSQEGGLQIALPASLANLSEGVHEVVIGGREIHVAVAALGQERIYRLYDYSAYERHFKDAINALMVGTGIFALLSVWLSLWLSGLLVRQVSNLSQQVQALRSGAASAINPGKYDEREVAALALTVNDYHGRMAAMIEREREFTGNVSHELRTPLTAIRTSCELLEHDSALDGKARQRLKQIEQAAADMHALVESLLALAREDSAQEVLPTPLAPAVQAALARFSIVLERHAVTPLLDIADQTSVQVNPGALAIVLSNLIDNALRHTRQGTLRFSYEAGALLIEDSGSGIAPQALPKLFDRFYREGEGSGQGYGIGLAIVKKICDRYGWPIRIESELGSGTRVFIGLHENFTRT